MRIKSTLQYIDRESKSNILVGSLLLKPSIQTYCQILPCNAAANNQPISGKVHLKCCSHT